MLSAKTIRHPHPDDGALLSMVVLSLTDRNDQRQNQNGNASHRPSNSEYYLESSIRFGCGIAGWSCESEESERRWNPECDLALVTDDIARVEGIKNGINRPGNPHLGWKIHPSSPQCCVRCLILRSPFLERGEYNKSGCRAAERH